MTHSTADTTPAMSLKRKLWLAICLVLGLAFFGTFLLSTLVAQRYFEQQLLVKNIDNATSLALSMTQLPKDMVTLELLLAAQFDAGHYRWIRLYDPNGELLLERQNQVEEFGPPAWFVKMIPLNVGKGVADVQDGWNQFGRLELQSHDRYAYTELWSGSKKMLVWFVGLAVIAGLLSSKLVGIILSPLSSVVRQAEAIGARRFISIEEPNTLEFRSLVRAMNTLSERVRMMLQQESKRIEKLHQSAQFDRVSGLLNRDAFMMHLESVLSRDGRESAGVFAILRIKDLSVLNQNIGHDAVNSMLQRAAQRLQSMAKSRTIAWTVGRLSGSDFAILAPDETHAEEVLELLASEWHLAMDEPLGESNKRLPVGGAAFYSGQARSELLAKADNALASAEESGKAVVRNEPIATTQSLPINLNAWRELLDHALQIEYIQLRQFPVLSDQGALMHQEVPVRLCYQGQEFTAGQFLAWVSRLGWMPRLDQLVFDLVWRELDGHGDDIALNVSPESMCDVGFIEILTRRLRERPELAQRLWLEVPEHGALHHLNEFRAFCTVLKPLHCRIGLKHAGSGFSRIGELHDVGLDHLKLDAALVRDIDQNTGNQAFLRGLCQIVHSVGLLAIAEGVQTQAELDTLVELGIDGVTGPAVREHHHGI